MEKFLYVVLIISAILFVVHLRGYSIHKLFDRKDKKQHVSLLDSFYVN